MEFLEKDIEKAKKILKEYKKNVKKQKLKFILPINPAEYSMSRPRAGKWGNIYVPNAKKHKDKIRNFLIKQLPKNFKITRTEIKVKFLYYIPISKSGFNKVDKYLAQEKQIRPLVKPDIDNIEKTIMDALTSVVWHDDSQVVTTINKKFYTTKKPYIKIIISFPDLFLSENQKKHQNKKK